MTYNYCNDWEWRYHHNGLTVKIKVGEQYVKIKKRWADTLTIQEAEIEVAFNRAKSIKNGRIIRKNIDYHLIMVNVRSTRKLEKNKQDFSI